MNFSGSLFLDAELYESNVLTDMLSPSIISVDWPVVANAELVEEVAKASGCREDMAIALLQVSPGNNRR